jgi:hypothetical protein
LWAVRWGPQLFSISQLFEVSCIIIYLPIQPVYLTPPLS